MNVALGKGLTVWDVVIGASVAGLSCAQALMGSDLSVLVLEKKIAQWAKKYVLRG